MQLSTPFIQPRDFKADGFDRRLFFRRRKVERDITQSLSLNQLTVLYGPPGSGKSLLAAGITSDLKGYYKEAGEAIRHKIRAITIACNEVLAGETRISSHKLKQLIYKEIYREAGLSNTSSTSESLVNVIERVERGYPQGERVQDNASEPDKIGQIWFILDDIDALMELGGIAKPLFRDIFKSIFQPTANVAYMFCLSDQNLDQFDELIASLDNFSGEEEDNEWVGIDSLRNQWSFISLERLNRQEATEALGKSLSAALSGSGDSQSNNSIVDTILELCKTQGGKEEVYSPLYIQAILAELFDQLKEKPRVGSGEEQREGSGHPDLEALRNVVDEYKTDRNRLLLASLLRAIQQKLKESVSEVNPHGEIDLYEIILVLSRMIIASPQATSHDQLPIGADEVAARCREFGTILDLKCLVLSRLTVERILDLLVDINILRLTLSLMPVCSVPNHNQENISGFNEEVFELSKKYTLRSPDLAGTMQALQQFYVGFLSTLFKHKRLPLHAAFERSEHRYDLACLLLYEAHSLDKKYQLGLSSEINEVVRSQLAYYQSQGDRHELYGIFSGTQHVLFSKALASFKEPDHNISSLIFCEEFQLILCGTVKGQILIYDLGENTEVITPQRYKIIYATFARQRITGLFLLKAESTLDCSSITFLTASEDGRIKRWNLQRKLDQNRGRGGTPRWSWSETYPRDRDFCGDMFPYRTDEVTDPITSLCGCRDCKIVVAAARSGDLYLLDFRDEPIEGCRKPIKTIPYQEEKLPATCLVWLGCDHVDQKNQNSFQIAVGQQDGKIVRLEFEKGKLDQEDNQAGETNSQSLVTNAQLLFQCPAGFPVQAITSSYTDGSMTLVAAAGAEPKPPLLVIWRNTNKTLPDRILSTPRLGKDLQDELKKNFKDSDGVNDKFLDLEILGDIERINTLALQEDGLLFIGGEDQKIRCIAIEGAGEEAGQENTRNQSSVFEPNYFGISQLALSRDRSCLISSGWNGTTSLWSLAGGADPQHPSKITSHQRNISSLAFNRDHSLLVTGSWDGVIQRWSLPSDIESDLTSVRLLPPPEESSGMTPGHQPYEFKGRLEPDQEGIVWDLCFSTEGSYVASTNPRDKLGICIWNTEELMTQGQCKPVDISFFEDISLHCKINLSLAKYGGEEIRSIAFNSNSMNRLIASGLWNDFETGGYFPRVLLHRFYKHKDTITSKLCGWISTCYRITSLCFHPEHDLLFAATDNGTVILVSVGNEQNWLSGISLAEGLLTEDPHRNGITTTELSHSQTIDQSISFLQENEKEKDIPKTGNTCFSCIDVFSIDQETNKVRLALGGKDNIVRIWEFEIKPPSANNGEVTIANAKVFYLEGHEYWISSVAFSPNGQKLASSSFDGTVRIWDLSNNQTDGDQGYHGWPLVLREHKESVTCAEFLREDLVVSGGYDNNVILWNTSLDKITTFLRNKIPRNLTKNEWDLYIGSRHLESRKELDHYMRFQYPPQYEIITVHD